MMPTHLLQLYFGRFVSVRAVIIFVFLLAMLIFAFCYALHLVIWLVWYPLKMRRWKFDFRTASDEESRRFLLFVRRTMRLRVLPIFLWWIK